MEREGLAPATLNVMLHSPHAREGDLLRMLPGLVRTRPRAMECWQAYHSINAERALSQGRPWVASFVKTGAGRREGTAAMLFAGLYGNPGPRRRPREEILADPEVRWLHGTFGSFEQLDDAGWDAWTWFDLTLTDRLSDLRGRLVVETQLNRSYVRLAENVDAPVTAIHAESAFDAAPPSWQEMRPSAGMLGVLPPSWAAKLREWRGIYLIVDERDGARYVGSAYGEENILGRWQAHVAGDHGITAGLRDREPASFRFSILELTAPSASADEVIRLEQTWMDRLHTRVHGLNAGGGTPMSPS